MSHVFPPFDPEEPPRRRGQIRPALGRRKIPVRLIIPNLFTILGLCAGLTAIRMAIEHRFDIAIAAIVLAAVLDALDGRVARLLKATSRFGAELDSLADFVDFGVAPAIIIFTWSLQGTGSVGWIVVLVFAVCAALRLARFNVALGNNEPDWKSNFFVGVPAPAGALTVLLPLYVAYAADMHWIKDLTPAMMIFTVIIAMLMVSNLPTYSGKKLTQRIERDLVLPIFLAVALGVAVLFSYPYASLALMSVVYLGTLPFGVVYYRKLEERAAKELARAAQPGRSKERSLPKQTHQSDVNRPH